MRICVVATPDGPAAAEIAGDRLVSIEGGVAESLLGRSADGPPGGLDLGKFAEATLLGAGEPKQARRHRPQLRRPHRRGRRRSAGIAGCLAKFRSSIVGPGKSIVVNKTVTEHVGWEVELGVVVGRSMRNVSADDALSYVLGYTVANHVSARDVQFADGQWVRGKSMDTFCPVGPWVVTADEVPDPQKLQLRTRVNDEVVQDASTSLMLFSVAELLAFCSASPAICCSREPHGVAASS